MRRKAMTMQPVKQFQRVSCLRRFCIAACLAAGMMLAGCKKKPAAAAGGGGGGFAVQAVIIEAKVQPVAESLSLIGTISANEWVEIKAEIDGTVEEIAFKEGQAVQAGDLLVRLNETKLAASVAEAEANFKLSESNFERSKQLLGEKLISLQEHDQVASLFQSTQATLDLRRRLLRDARVLAPFEGITGARQISPGQVITKATTLTWLVDLDPVKVEVEVPERYLGQLALGQKMDFTVAAYPKDRFSGEVYFISPQLDRDTRTALVKATIPNPGHKLKGGMFASLALTVTLRDSAVVIPEPAIMTSADAFSVFVVDEKNTAQIRPVKIGLRLAGKAEVVSGLAAGEKVVVEGIQKLGPGVPVKPGPPESAAPYLN